MRQAGLCIASAGSERALLPHGARRVCGRLTGILLLLVVTWIAMQMVERPWGVAAYGAASVKAAPDLIRVRFKVVHLERTASRSFAQASDAARAVRDVLRRHGLPDRAVENSRLGLKSLRSYGADRKFLGYTSARRRSRWNPRTLTMSSNC